MTNYITATSLNSKKEEFHPVIPLLNEMTSKNFACDGSIGFPKVSAGTVYTTGPLATDQRIDLLAISQADEFIRQGIIDVSSTICPEVNLETVYISVGGSVLRFDVSKLTQAKGIMGTVLETRGCQWLLESTVFLLTEDTRDVFGNIPYWTEYLNIIETDIELSVKLHGTLGTSIGWCEFSGSAVVSAIHDMPQNNNNSRLIALVKTLFRDIKVVGYELDAAFTK